MLSIFVGNGILAFEHANSSKRWESQSLGNSVILEENFTKQALSVVAVVVAVVAVVVAVVAAAAAAAAVMLVVELVAFSPRS